MFSVRGQHSGVWRHLSSHLLLAVILCHAFHVGGWLFMPKGMIEEDASYNSMYYVGKNLTVQCIKFSDFTGDVYFQQGNVNYSQEYVTQINTTHALLDKPVTDDDFKETTLFCADDDGLVATAVIYTDYAPREATDLKMVWLDEQFLFINWAFNNTSYKHGHDNGLIEVTGEWSYNASNANGWNVCYSGVLNKAACVVTGISNEWATVYVRVNITNVRRNDLVSTLFPGLPIRNHVKPRPAQQVNVVAVSSTTARVNVTADGNLQIFCHIKYFTKLGDNFINNTLVIKKTKERIDDNIPGLHPDYTYHFEVRWKVDINRGYLSDLPQSIPEVRMPEDAPSAAPEVEPGSFYLDRSSCNSSDSSQAGLYIYYQELAEEDKNGNIVNYTATVVVDGKNVTYTQSGTPCTPSTVKLDYVPCDGNYDVTLHANTAVGPSPGAVLHVPRWSEESDGIVDKLKLQLRQDNGAITAEWEPVADTHNMSLLVYYCNKASPDNGMCQSAIRHVNITAANGSYPLTAADANMKFGVAAILQDDGTTGIKFTECIYDPTKVSPIPSNVRGSGQTDSILVMWKGEDACDSTKRFIIYNYEIELVVPSGSEIISHVVDASSGVHQVRNVRQNIDYQVRMRANTSSGVSDFSQPVSARLPSTVTGLTDEEIAGIAMAVLVVVLILGVLVFCFCRDKFRAVKAKFSRDADIPAPTPRRVPREFQTADSSLGGICNQGFVPENTSATLTHQDQDSQDSGYIGQDNSPSTSRQLALQGTESVPPTEPTDLTITVHTQSASPDRNVASTLDVTMADGDIQGDDSGCVVSSGEVSAAAVVECKPAPIPVPACFGEGESDEGQDTVGKGIVKDSPSLSDAGSNSYVRFSTCPRQGGEHLPGSPAQVVIKFSKEKGSATFEPVVGVVHVALSDSGTMRTAGNGADSEAMKTAKLDSKKEDNGWAARAETVTNPTQDFTPDSAMNSADRNVTVSVPERQGPGSYSQISPSGVTEKSRGQGTQEGEPSDELLEASPATVSPGYVTHDVTSPQAQTDPTSHVNERDTSDRLRDEPRPRSQEEPSSFTDTSLSPSAPGGRLDEPRNPANVNPEPENMTPQELTPLPADSLSCPLQKPDDPQIDRDIDPAPQGHFDQKSEADIPPLSAMPGGYVLRHATSPDVSLPCPPPVQDGDDSEGGSQHTEKDAARPEEPGSSLSESTPSHSSNGGGYVPLDTVEKMTLILDSSAAMVTADESDGGWREGGGGRGCFGTLDSGYSSPNSLQRSPQWRSSPGFTSVQGTPHNDNDDGTFNLAPGEPARAPTKTGVAKQSHGERIKGENAGKERGSLGGALVMSFPMRQASSGYVERNDVFAAPSETSV